MKNCKIILLLVTLCCTLSSKAQNDNSEFGLWTEVGVKKEITKEWSASLDGEFRTQNGFNNVDRWSVAIGTDYNVTKWFKVGASYTYLYSFKPSETKDHLLYKEEDSDFPLLYDGLIFKDGYNVTSYYWTNRHRVKFDITFDHKFMKCIKVSLRGRYQYTYRPEQRVDRMKHRYVFDRRSGNYEFEQDGVTIKEREPEYDDNLKRRNDDHSLRTKLEIEYDKKKVDWSPFVSFEICNDLRDALKSEKCRTSLGCSYKVAKGHSVKAAYLYNHVFDASSTDAKHILTLGYSFKF